MRHAPVRPRASFASLLLMDDLESCEARRTQFGKARPHARQCRKKPERVKRTDRSGF
jgi:hypothetical protein